MIVKISRGALILGLALSVVVGLEFRTFVLPVTDRPTSSGLVVILGDTHRGARYGTAAYLASSNRWLLISIYDYCPAGKRPELSAYAHQACFRPSPLTTRGEAKFAAQYAKSRGLTSITVITTADQVWRARLRFARCWPGSLAVVAAPSGLATQLRRVPYETGASIKALAWQREC